MTTRTKNPQTAAPTSTIEVSYWVEVWNTEKWLSHTFCGALSQARQAVREVSEDESLSSTEIRIVEVTTTREYEVIS